MTRDQECAAFLEWVAPRLGLRARGFRRVRGQVCKRLLRRMRELGLPDLASYRARVASDPGELARVGQLCQVTISRFARDRAIFERLRRVHAPRLAAEAGVVRILSAGCASGEEPYSLAILWNLELGRPVEIVALDANPTVLARAREGLYEPGPLRELPPEWIDRAFTREGRLLRLRDEHRIVRFEQADLREAPLEGPFDLILCRNLAFTYFSEEVQRVVAARLVSALRPGGLLVVGLHERPPEGVNLEELERSIWLRPGRTAGPSSRP